MNELFFDIDSIELNEKLFGKNYGSYHAIGVDGLVYGRNCKHDIPVKTVFTRVSKMACNEIEELTNIELELISVEFYRKSVEFIPGGHTARIELKGRGLRMLSEIVQSLKEGEHVRIEA